jgi:hypothetical protein
LILIEKKEIFRQLLLTKLDCEQFVGEENRIAVKSETARINAQILDVTIIVRVLSFEKGFDSYCRFVVVASREEGDPVDDCTPPPPPRRFIIIGNYFSI